MVVRIAIAAALLVACGRISFDPVTAGDARSGTDAALAACTQWGPFGAPDHLAAIATPYNDWGPSPNHDGSRLAFSWWNDTVFEFDVAIATADAFGTFGSTAVVVSGLDTTDHWEMEPTFTRDDSGVVFTSEDSGGAWSINHASFTSPTTVGPIDTLVNTGLSNYNHDPELSADGLRVYYTTNNYPPTNGNFQIVVASRTATSQAFPAPTVFTELDTADNECCETLSRDELEIVFSSDRVGGQGYDLYRATRTSRSLPFSAPALIPELETALDDMHPALSADGSTLYYNRGTLSGGGADADVWFATRPCLAR